MREFFDTSVLVASFWGGHIHHEASINRLSVANTRQSACGIHSLAEVYAVMTSLPVKPPIPPEQGVLFIQEIRDRLTVISLTADEYFTVIQQTAEKGFASGRIYDALLLACAAKTKVHTIYTWNVSHFQAIAPDLAAYIRTP